MSNFLKKATELLLSKKTPPKKNQQVTETGSIGEAGQPKETGDAERGKPEEEEQTEMKLKDRGKLFVGGLNYATTAEGLKAYFSRFGSVVDAVVMAFPNTKKSRGYGFVTFADPASAEIALTVESHVVDGKAVDIRLFKSNRQKKRKRKDPRLFLGGIPLDMKEEDMKNFFSRYGKVTELVIPHSRTTNKPKGFAFLSFEEKEAADKCLSESFVYLGSKRVMIKEATPRGESTETKTLSDVADGVECLESDLESATGYEDDVWSLPDDDGQSSASGERTSLFEQYPGFLSIFENYFQPKIALGNKMEKGEEDKEWRPPAREEWEKLLVNLLGESSRAEDDTFSGDDDDDDDEEEEEDSDGSDVESVSDEDEDDYDDTVDEEDDDDDDGDDDDDDDDHCDNFYEKLKEILIAKTAEEKIGNLKSSVHENQVPISQSSLLPFIVQDKAGSLRCSLCQWTPPDGSSEAFLAHCKTPGHIMKTKERFAPEDIQQGKLTNKPTYLSREIDPRMVSSQTQLNRIRQGLSEEKSKLQTAQDSKEQRKEKLLPSPVEHMPQQQHNQQVTQKQKKKKPQQQSCQEIHQQQQHQQKKAKKQQQQLQPGQEIHQQQQKKTKNKQQQQQQPGQEIRQQQSNQQTSQQKIQKKNQNSESESGKVKETKKVLEHQLNLKVHALAKGMVCIQPVSANELSCKMCNKTIPKAPDFAVLMKNVSSHLQSKRHLNKLAMTESSLKSALEKNPEGSGQSQKNVSGKNTKAGKKEQTPAQKEMPKGKNTGSGNNCKKTHKKILKGAPAAAAAAAAEPRINFLCVSCNYFANKQETFSAHIKSKLHSDTANKNNSNFVPSSVLCKGCNRLLFGSLYDINKHNIKCSK